MTPLRNRWPCCGRKTQWHDIEQYGAGTILIKECPRDGRKWEVTFAATSIDSMPGLLKIEWKEIKKVPE